MVRTEKPRLAEIICLDYTKRHDNEIKTTSAEIEPHKRAVIYARVSSKEQEKEGYSIPAQLKLLKDYAATEGFTIAQEYVDVETVLST